MRISSYRLPPMSASRAFGCFSIVLASIAMGDARAATQAERSFCIGTTTTCFTTLKQAEAFLRIEPNPPIGRAFLEKVIVPGGEGYGLLPPPPEQAKFSGRGAKSTAPSYQITHQYRVKDRVSEEMSTWWQAGVGQGCLGDPPPWPVCSSCCGSDTILKDRTEAYFEALPTHCDVTMNLNPVPETPYTDAGTHTVGDYLGIPWIRLLQFQMLANSSSSTISYRQQSGNDCLGPLTTSPLASLGQTAVHVCEPLFEAKRYQAPPSASPFLCFNVVADSIVEKKPGQYCSDEKGNPCSPATGQKLRHETDFDVDGMHFERHYHSLATFASNSGLGGGWTHNYDSRISGFTPEIAPASTASVFVIDSRGELDQFRYAGNIAGEATYRSINRKSQLLRQRGNPLMWELQLDGNRTNVYDITTKRLVKMLDRSQPANDLTLTHDQHGRLMQVQNAKGRKIEFFYSGWNLTKVTAPDGQEYLYSVGASGLEGVTYPGGALRSFDYDNSNFPSHLTGIHDENGDHYGEFSYDSIGRVVSSKLKTGNPSAPDAEQISLVYQVGSTKVTTALGEEQTYQFSPGFFEELVGLSDSAGTFSTAYRSDGRVDYTIDKKGVRTAYGYDDTHQTVRIDAQSSDTQPANAFSDERKTETSWHSTLDVVTERRVYRCSAVSASPQPCSGAGGSELWQLESLSRFAYNARGQITARCEVDPGNGAAMAYICGSSTNAPTGVRQTSIRYCESGDVTTPGSGCSLLGLLKAVDGPRTDVADTTTYTYYDGPPTWCNACAFHPNYLAGDLATVTNALGQVTSYLSYDAAGRVNRMQDANGVITDIKYHIRGWLAKRTVRANSDGTQNATLDATTSLTYDNTGQVTRITQPDGAYVNYTYDDAHRLTDIVDNLGNKISYTLDAAGNRTAENTSDLSNALTRTLGRVYNPLGQLQALLNAQNEQTVFTYDANGNQDIVTDALTRPTNSDVDPLNRLIQSTDALMGQTKYRYDARDNLVEVIDAKTLGTLYTYDGLNDLTQLVSPDTGTTSYTYDSAGNRATQTDARLVTSTYAYDSLNRLTGISYPTASNNVAFTYDEVNTECDFGEEFGIGRLTGFTDPSGSTKLCYDLRGNVKRKIAVVNGNTLVTRWYYNTADRVVTMVYPSELQVDYGRDELGRVVTVDVTPSGYGTERLVNDVTYYPFGPVNQITWGNNSTSTRTYDQNYWIDSIDSSQADGLDLDFTLDEVGNIVGLSDGVPGGATPDNVYDYDELYRLADVDATGGANVETYTYDAIGNRLTKKVGTGSPEVYAYPSNSHRLSSTPSTDRDYDDNGNTTTFNKYIQWTPTLEYDERNRFSAYRDGLGLVTHGYAYNARGERVYKGVTDQPKANSRSFGYDENGRLLLEANRDGKALQEFIWLDDLPVGVYTSETLHYIQPDHLGSPRKVIDTRIDGAIWDWPILDNPFGEAAPNQDPDGDSTDFVLNLRFPGQYFDVETGLHYNYFRDYEPGTGRYVESDPIGLDGGIDTYSYANSDPLTHDDETGEIGAAARFGAAALGGALKVICRRAPHLCKEAMRCVLNPSSCKRKFCTFMKTAGGSRMFYHPICDQPGCNAGDGFATKLFKLDAAEACLTMRIFVRFACYNGRSDANHKREEKIARDKIADCITCM